MMITGTYNANDLISAAWVHLRPRRSLALLGFVVIGLVVLAIFLALFGEHADGSGWVRWALPLVLLYLAVAWVSIPYKSRRTFKQRKDLQRPFSFTAFDSGLSFSTEGVSGTKPWTDYLKWKEGRTTILLYISDNMYQIIPKRFFTSERDLVAFRELISQMVARRDT